MTIRLLEDISCLESIVDEETYSSIITDESSKVYGIYDDIDLIGYIDTEDAINYSCSKYWDSNSILITNIYINDKHRGFGYAKDAVTLFLVMNDDISIFIENISDKYLDWYLSIGFIDEQEILVKPKKKDNDEDLQKETQ